MSKSGEVRAFLEEAFATEAGACILWPFSLSGNGYPQINIGGRVQRVNRYVCERHRGPPPDPGMDAAHSCNRELCINKRHLSWKTRVDNMADAIAAGTTLRGERNTNSTLTDDKVLAMRAATGSLREIGKQFGVGFSTVGKILRRERWKHI